ncbi:MAG: DUF3566 domain-containing protein [Acidimicrobiia bacterium]|nr:DUF3566 domain-containing protein [Acidimicrobiia bacterium]
MDYSGRELERLRRLDVAHVLRTALFLSVFVAVLFTIASLAIWQALHRFEVVDSAEELAGKLAGGTFHFDEAHLLTALLLLVGAMVVALTAAAGVGAAVYNQVAETAGGVEFLAEDVVRRRDRDLVQALRRRSPQKADAPRELDSDHRLAALEAVVPAAAREAAATLAPPARLVAVVTAAGSIDVQPFTNLDSTEHGVPVPAHGLDSQQVHRVAVVSEEGLVAITGAGRFVDTRGRCTSGSDTCPGDEGRDRPAALLDRAALERDPFCVLVTQQGKVTRVPCPDLLACPPRIGVALIDTGDSVVSAVPTSDGDDLVLVTRHGKALRFSEADVPTRGIGAKMTRGIRLEGGDQVAAVSRVVPEGVLDLLTVTTRGCAKRTPIERFGVLRPGTRGLRAATPTDASGPVATAAIVAASDDVLIGSSRNLVRLAATEVRRQGRASAGLRLVDLDPDDRVVAVAVISNR